MNGVGAPPWSAGGSAVDEKKGGGLTDHRVSAHGLQTWTLRELVAHAHPGAELVARGDGVLIGHRASGTVLEAPVVRGGRMAVVRLGGSAGLQ